MSAAPILDNNDRDAGVVEEICGYLTEEPPRSYFFFAGAGSGKTRTLVEVLRRLTGVIEHVKERAASTTSADVRAFDKGSHVH
jgi:DNA helicase-2/ATP-dependent DNA helicase PcrA